MDSAKGCCNEDVNKTTTCTCRRNFLPTKISNYACCGSKLFNKNTHVCCEDLSVHQNTNGHKCCCTNSEDCSVFDPTYFQCKSGNIIVKIPAVIQHHKWLLNEIVQLLKEVVDHLKHENKY
ncbi:galaxin-like [Protopterus annectens]|uniref:galaxin-like n=1 Tax=Protopterus annectens TaxID=7888 RepID=UPI001CFA0DBD|nr:galaxin-like [Protopterus annectens]